MSKRLCIKCGLTRPLSEFNRTHTGEYARICMRHASDSVSLTKKMKRKKRQRKLKAIEQHENYMRARHRGPRRVTQMKANRLPQGVPLGLTANDYAIYLTSPHWEEFRSRYVNANPWACFVCGGHPDHLHHVNYGRLGFEEFEDVVPLCGEHHRMAHRAVKQGVSLKIAHIYVKSRFDRGELEIKITKLDN